MVLPVRPPDYSKYQTPVSRPVVNPFWEWAEEEASQPSSGIDYWAGIREPLENAGQKIEDVVGDVKDKLSKYTRSFWDEFKDIAGDIGRWILIVLILLVLLKVL